MSSLLVNQPLPRQHVFLRMRPKGFNLSAIDCRNTLCHAEGWLLHALCLQRLWSVGMDKHRALSMRLCDRRVAKARLEILDCIWSSPPLMVSTLASEEELSFEESKLWLRKRTHPDALGQRGKMEGVGSSLFFICESRASLLLTWAAQLNAAYQDASPFQPHQHKEVRHKWTILADALRSGTHIIQAKGFGGIFFWRVTGRESDSPELPGSPCTSQNVPHFSGSSPAAFPELLSLWILRATQKFPRSFPDFLGTSPDFHGSSGTSPELSAFSGKPDTL